jgi:hypothetical protein
VKKLAADWNLTVDDEFKNLLDPQCNEERSIFEDSLLKEGCRDALVIWREPRIIVDGHHRFGFCSEHGIPFGVIEMDFADRDEAKMWIIRNQLARRNLPPHRRGLLALELKPIIEAKARENLVAGADMTNTGLQKSVKAVNTQKELAKIAGVSHDTIDKVEKIEKNAPEPIKQASRRGEISVNAAYQATKLPQEKQEEIVKEAERGEKPIKQIVNDAIKAEREVGYMQEAAVAFSSGEAYNLDNLVEEVIENGEDCVDAIRTQIETRITLFDSAGGRIADAIDKIINSFVELKREVNEKWK